MNAMPRYLGNVQDPSYLTKDPNSFLFLAIELFLLETSSSISAYSYLGLKITVSRKHVPGRRPCEPGHDALNAFRCILPELKWN